MASTLFVGFFKDNNGDVHKVERADKKFHVDGTEYATGWFYTDNMSVDYLDNGVFDSLPKDWVKVDSPV